MGAGVLGLADRAGGQAEGAALGAVAGHLRWRPVFSSTLRPFFPNNTPSEQMLMRSSRLLRQQLYTTPLQVNESTQVRATASFILKNICFRQAGAHRQELFVFARTRYLVRSGLLARCLTLDLETLARVFLPSSASCQIAAQQPKRSHRAMYKEQHCKRG